MEFLKGVLGAKFDVHFAQDDERALELLRRVSVDLVLSDAEGWLRLPREELKPKGIPIIVLTTCLDPEQKIAALEGGVDDYLCLPVSERELVARVSNLLAVRGERLKFLRELEIGKRLQRALLPAPVQIFGDARLSALFLPVEDLSGDFYDIRASGGWIYFYLADVTGHGFAAAQVTLLLKELFHGALDHDPVMGLVELLKWIANKYSTYGLEKDLAFQIARYHLKDRRFEYVRANAPGALKVQADMTVVRTHVKSGPTISTDSAHYFDPCKFHVYMDTLRPGESVYLFTDGAYELLGEDGAPNIAAGRKWLSETLAKAPFEGWQEYFVDSFAKANGTSRFTDDVTAIRLDAMEFNRSLIVTQEAGVAKRLKAGIENRYHGFKVVLVEDLGKALAWMDEEGIDAVVLQDAALESLPMERKFATILVSSRPEVSLAKALAGRLDLVFSEPFELADLMEAVKNPSVQRQKQWRRSLERVDVAVRLNVELTGVLDIRQGDVVNIGLGGLFIGISFPMPGVGEKISFRIQFGSSDKESASIEGIGIVRWVRPESSGPQRAGCGVQFLSLTESSIRNLHRILEISKAKELIPLF